VIGVIRQVEQGSSGDSGTEGEQQRVDTQNVEWPDVVFLDTLATSWVQSSGSIASIFPNEGSVSLSASRSSGEVLIWAPSWSEFILVDWSEVTLTLSIWVSVGSSLPDISQQETSKGDGENEQDKGNHTQNEESGSVSEESNNNSEGTNNDTSNSDSLKELSVEKTESLVSLEFVPFEGFFTPVDHQPSEDNETNAGEVQSVGSKLESVVSNGPGSISTESKSEGSDSSENDEPVEDSSVSSPGLSKIPIVWHVSVPFVSGRGPRSDSAQVSWLVESQPKGSSSEVNGEDQRTGKGKEGESTAWRLSNSNAGSSSSSPSGNGETDEHTEGSHEGVPEGDASSVSVVQDPSKNQSNKAGNTGDGSEDHGELGISDFVFNVSWFSGEEVVSLKKRDFVISLGLQRKSVVLEG
jgi:hypothetical protein